MDFWKPAVDHLVGRFGTFFSSWTPDLHTALEFATRTGCGSGAFLYIPGSLAVLDVKSWLTEAERRLRIFHILALQIPPGGRMPKGWKNWPREPNTCEYLIWGPVTGPAMRLVAIDRIQREIRCCLWPVLVIPPMPHQVAPREVHDAAKIGALFRRVGDGAAGAALALSVAAAELARRQYKPPLPKEWEEDKNYRKWLHLTWGSHGKQKFEIMCLLFKFIPGLAYAPFDKLINYGVNLVGFPQVQLMYDLLYYMQMSFYTWAAKELRGEVVIFHGGHGLQASVRHRSNFKMLSLGAMVNLSQAAFGSFEDGPSKTIGHEI